MDQYKEIMERYERQIKVDVGEVTSYPAHLKFPLQLLKDLWDSTKKKNLYLTNTEDHPELEEHGLPRNLDLSTILVEDIFQYTDLASTDIKIINEIRIKDGILSIDLVVCDKN